MPKLEPDSVNPKCLECGELLEDVAHWSKGKGTHYILRCPNCERSERDD